MNIAPEALLNMGLNVAALVVFLGVVWWRLNRIERSMQEHKAEHRQANGRVARRLDNHGSRLSILDKHVERQEKMPKTHAALVNEVEELLEDSSNAVWGATVVANALDAAIREFSSYSPDVALVTREFESRTGYATAATAGTLTDTTNSPFFTRDVGKVVFNVTDNTWAIVIAWVSTSVLTLSHSIMATGEQYVMYNQDCWSPYQIYLGDITDYVDPDRGIDAVYYPAQGSNRTRRNFTVDHNVLTVLYDGSIPDSSQANLGSRVVEVDIWVRRQHKVSRMTGFAAAIDLTAGYGEGATTIHVDGLVAAAETAAEDQEFSIAGARRRYRLTQATTFASNEGDITFFPPLEAAFVDDIVVTFTQSSLNREQERVVVDLCAGRLSITKSTRMLQEINTAIASITSGAAALGQSTARLSRQMADIASARTAADLMPGIILKADASLGQGAARLSRQITDVASARTAAALMAAVALEANTEVDKMAVEMDKAAGALTSGEAATNRVNKGGPNVPGQYSATASQYVNVAQGRLATAQGFFAQIISHSNMVKAQIDTGAGELAGAQGSAEESRGFLAQVSGSLEAVRAQMETGAGELAGAQGSVNEAMGYIQKAALELQVGAAAREYRIWGQNKVEQAIRDTRRPLLPKQRRTYSRL